METAKTLKKYAFYQHNSELATLCRFPVLRPLVGFCLASKSYQMRNIDMYNCCSDIDTCQVKSMNHYNFSFQGQ